VSLLSNGHLARLERLIEAADSPLSHKKVELTVASHLNHVGLAWPSIERIHLLVAAHCRDVNGRPLRGPGALGTSARTVKRALAASGFYITVAALADNHRQGRGGWFAHGALRALPDPVRERIGLGVSLAESVDWAAAKGLTVPLGELPSRGYDAEFGTQGASRNPAFHHLGVIEFGPYKEEKQDRGTEQAGADRKRKGEAP
jgi:hypothetical protein